jgi:hypothetical protein
MKFDKIIYIKGIDTSSFFNKTKTDLMIRWSKVEHLTYCKTYNETKMEVKDNILSKTVITFSGNMIPPLIKSLTKTNTKGVIVKSNGEIGDIL